MKVDRYETRKKTNPLLVGCGCLFLGILILGAGVLLALIFFRPTIQSIVLGAVGFEDLGTVDTVLSEDAQVVPQLENPQTVDNVVLQGGDFSQTLDNIGEGYTVQTGMVDSAQQLQIAFDEAGLLSQCQQFTPICSSNQAGIRNASFDLKPNAVIIRGEFEIQSGFWQSAGLVLHVQNDTRLSVLGLEIGGQIFATESSELNALIADAELQVNQLLQTLTAQAGGINYSLSNLIIDETTLTVIMR